MHKTICVPPEHARYFRKLWLEEGDDLSTDGESDGDPLDEA